MLIRKAARLSLNSAQIYHLTQQVDQYRLKSPGH